MRPPARPRLQTSTPRRPGARGASAPRCLATGVCSSTAALAARCWCVKSHPCRPCGTGTSPLDTEPGRGERRHPRLVCKWPRQLCSEPPRWEAARCPPPGHGEGECVRGAPFRSEEERRGPACSTGQEPESRTVGDARQSTVLTHCSPLRRNWSRRTQTVRKEIWTAAASGDGGFVRTEQEGLGWGWAAALIWTLSTGRCPKPGSSTLVNRALANTKCAPI